MPLAFTLALTSLTYLIGIGGVGLIILPIKILGGVDSFVLLAIPLFILAGALMESGGISERIVDLAMAIVGKVRGGLAMVVVVAEISSPEFPARRRPTFRRSARCSCHRCARPAIQALNRSASSRRVGDGHPRAAVPDDGGARIAGEPVDRDAVPCRLHPRVHSCGGAARADRRARTAAELAGDDRCLARQLGRATRRAIVPMGLPVVLFGGIFSGATTVTEAALIAVVYALVAGIVVGGVRRPQLVGQLAQSGVVTATTLWVLAAASAFAWILVREWVPQALGEWIASVGAGRSASWR